VPLELVVLDRYIVDFRRDRVRVVVRWLWYIYREGRTIVMVTVFQLVDQSETVRLILCVG